MERRTRRVRWLAGVPLVIGLVLSSLAAGSAVRAAELSVPEHGVGRDVVDRELQEPAARFQEGAKVWFWTRVVGGSEGGRIHHVWLQDGEERLKVELKVDGTPWRTYSNKSLHPGSRGSWTVEARDDAGRVLASETFECAAPDAPDGKGG